MTTELPTLCAGCQRLAEMDAEGPIPNVLIASVAISEMEIAIARPETIDALLDAKVANLRQSLATAIAERMAR